MPKIVLSTLDVPNKNNRVYTEETFKDCLGKSVFGVVGQDDPSVFNDRVDLSKVGFMVTELRIEEGQLVGTLQTYPNDNGIIVNEDMDFRPNGYGNLQEDGTVTNYRIVSISALSKGEGA